MFRCGHCKNLAAPLAAAAAELAGEAKVVAVDATAHQSLGADYGVKGFPTCVALLFLTMLPHL